RQAPSEALAPPRRANTAPSHGYRPGPHTPLAFPVATPRPPAGHTVGPAYRHSLTDTFGSGELSGEATPDSALSSLDRTRTDLPVQAQPSLGEDDAFPDLNAMMFPSADPFAYPNQPMTTLENRQYQYPGAFVPPTEAKAGPGREVYVPVDEQLFGQAAPYLPEGAQEQRVGGPLDMAPQMDLLANDLLLNSANFGLAPSQAFSSQPPGGEITGAQGINLDELFGEHWADVMGDTPGFRH
ncbi:MAG: hypothetical protein M1832_004607, partial [Thelocarpon impressellum]